MNKKFFYIFVTILIIIIIAFFIYKYFNTQNNSIDNNISTHTDRLATNIQIENSQIKESEISNRIEAIAKTPTEEEISSFSTPLKSKLSNRLNNINITCSKLNGVIVSNGETFSFCGTTGPSTKEQGYKKADVFINGKTVKALGGGNCQISSTLYNAVLAVSGLEVIERHEHQKDVSYVPEGKDAAVSYGSVDFKFKNNIGNDIKLYFSSDKQNVSVKISKIIIPS